MVVSSSDEEPDDDDSDDGNCLPSLSSLMGKMVSEPNRPAVADFLAREGLSSTADLASILQADLTASFEDLEHKGLTLAQKSSIRRLVTVASESAADSTSPVRPGARVSIAASCISGRSSLSRRKATSMISRESSAAGRNSRHARVSRGSRGSLKVTTPAILADDEEETEEPAQRSSTYSQRRSTCSQMLSSTSLGRSRPSLVSQISVAKAEEPILHPVWANTPAGGSKRSMLPQYFSGTMNFDQLGTQDDVDRHEPCLVIKPSSKPRWFWELIGLGIMVYQVYWIPFTVFDPPETYVFRSLQLFAVVYWAADIVLTFFTGYAKRDGTLEMRKRFIALNYAKTWLALDVIFVTLDILSEVSLSANGFSTIKVAMRIGRFLRLLRVIKVGRMSESSLARVQSIELLTMIRMASSTVLIHCLSHWMACGWYAVGLLMEENWLVYNGVGGMSTKDRPLAYKYWTSMHWSLCQLGVGSIEVMPVNTVERMYAVLVLIVALLSSSFFVSRVTALMVDLQSVKASQSDRERRLREYLNDNNVSLGLKHRIWKYLQDLQRVDRKIIIRSTVHLISMLPKDMLVNLNSEVYWPPLKTHSFFLVVGSFSGYEGARRDLVNNCIDEMTLEIEKELFDEGDPAERMFFVRGGAITYKYTSWSSSSNGRGELVAEGKWLSEIALWLNTCHMGTAVAAEPCQLLVIDAAAFRETFQKRSLARNYARKFLEYIKQTPDEFCDYMVGQVPLLQNDMEAWRSRVTGSEGGSRIASSTAPSGTTGSVSFDQELRSPRSPECASDAAGAWPSEAELQTQPPVKDVDLGIGFASEDDEFDSDLKLASPAVSCQDTGSLKDVDELHI